MKFTIAIPAYKGKYLFEAIESCLNQTYRDFELIIVDDASPENLISIVNKFNDSRIKYYFNEFNSGAKEVVDNWNKCLSYASADYIICMGDDDRLRPDCLQEYCQLISKYPSVNIFHGRTIKIDDKGEIISLTSERMELENIYTFIWRRLQGRSQYIGDVCIKTDILRQNGGYYKMPFAWGSDDLTAFIACGLHGVANTYNPVFEYRISNLTISKTGNEKEKMLSILKVFDWISSFLDKNPPTNYADIMVVNEIRDNWKYFLELKQKGTLKPAFKRSRLEIIRWAIIRKKYELSMKTIVKTAFSIYFH